jgi:uncharacterized UBP type Zn finger protein
MEIIDPALEPDQAAKRACSHAPDVLSDPRTDRCEECGSGFNLRSCTVCGHVGCCESQAGHARAHALSEHHPVIEQMTSGGAGFAWCYDENRYVR